MGCNSIETSIAKLPSNMRFQPTALCFALRGG